MRRQVIERIDAELRADLAAPEHLTVLARELTTLLGAAIARSRIARPFCVSPALWSCST